MHTPLCESNNINILTFDAAMKNRDPEAIYDRKRWIYVPDFYSEYRYILGTVGNNPLITIGINPSTAEPDNLDNTLKSVERIALHNGFDSFIMFNVYAQRATDPNMMDKSFNESLHTENMQAFRWVLERAGNAPSIWAAWGTIVEKRDYLKICLRDMVNEDERYGARWYTAGKRSAKGHPHHPLYLKKDSLIEHFDMRDYLNTI